MPKRKKSSVDLVDIEILSSLCYIDEGTAFKIGNKLGLSKATVSDRLKWLVEQGYLQPPIEDTSTGRLRKLYRPPSKKVVFELLKEYYNQKKGVDPKAFKDFIIEEVIRHAYGLDFNDLLDWLDIDSALTYAFNDKYYYLLAWDVLGLVEVEEEDNVKFVKLTKKGFEEVKSYYVMIIEFYLSELEEFSRDAYNDFIKQLCSKSGEDLKREFLKKIEEKKSET